MRFPKNANHIKKVLVHSNCSVTCFLRCVQCHTAPEVCSELIAIKVYVVICCGSQKCIVHALFSCGHCGKQWWTLMKCHACIAEILALAPLPLCAVKYSDVLITCVSKCVTEAFREIILERIGVECLESVGCLKISAKWT